MVATPLSARLSSDLPRERPLPTLVGAVLASVLAGSVGGLATAGAIDGWYATLARPDLAPPNWVFGPVWTTLFALMGVAAWLVWRRGDHPGAPRALAVFAIQFGCNVAWSFVFFGAQSPLGGLAVIALLWALVGTTIVGFWRIDRRAAVLLVPYIAWVSFAGLLNYAFWVLN